MFLARKTANKMLYTKKMTAPQTNTAICWLFASVMRGTRSARVMVENVKTPSANTNRQQTQEPQVVTAGTLTQRSHKLALHAHLRLEPRRKILDAALAVAGDVRHRADVVEHVPGREQQDCNHAETRPHVAVIQQRRHPRPRDHHARQAAQRQQRKRQEAQPVEGPVHRGLGRVVGEVSREPALDGLGRLRSCVLSAPCLVTRVALDIPHGEVELLRAVVWLGVRSNSRSEEEQVRGSLQSELLWTRQP